MIIHPQLVGAPDSTRLKKVKYPHLELSARTASEEVQLQKDQDIQVLV